MRWSRVLRKAIEQAQPSESMNPSQTNFDSSPDASEGDLAQAIRHERGRGAKKDFYLALKHYRAAAKAGSLPAQLRLAHIYLVGEKLQKPRYKEASDFFYLAANQKCAEAQRELGWMYYQGRGVLEDPAQAINYLRLAADQGDVLAMDLLGWVYFHGRKTKKWRVVKGRFQYLKDPIRNDRKAFEWLSRSSELGHVGSMHGLAMCLLDGKGVRQKPAEGMRWLRQAANHGVQSAQYELGLILSEGSHGQSVNRIEALRWLKRAATSNESQIFFNAVDKIWRTYFYGEGVERNYRAARLWLEKSLKYADEEDAMGVLVEIYEKGLGIKANPRKAAFWKKRLGSF